MDLDVSRAHGNQQNAAATSVMPIVRHRIYRGVPTKYVIVFVGMIFHQSMANYLLQPPTRGKSQSIWASKNSNQFSRAQSTTFLVGTMTTIDEGLLRLRQVSQVVPEFADAFFAPVSQSHISRGGAINVNNDR